jgi:uncharacterized protein (PEP-CTERM system associated)
MAMATAKIARGSDGWLYRKRRRLASTVAAILAAAQAPDAGAGDWTVAKGVTLNATYSDNATLSTPTEPKSDDLFLQVQPFFTAEGEGGRLKGRAYYLLSAYTGTFGGSSGGVANFLDASGTAEIAQDAFYVDVKAKADMGGTDPLGPSGIDYLYGDENVTQRFGVSVTPYAVQRLGSRAELYGRLGVDAVYYGESTSLGGDSTALRYDLGVKSGTDFTRLPWRLRAEGREESYSSGSSAYGDSSNYNRLVGDTSYVVSVDWRLNGSLGYEQNEYETTRDDTSGAIWSLGATWTPSERTSLTAAYGQRYFGPYGSLDFSHTHRRLRWYARYNRDLSTAQREFLDSQVFTVTNVAGQPVVNGVTTGTQVETQLSPRLSNETYLLDSFVNGIVYQGNRTSVGLDLVYNQRSYQLSGGDTSDWGVRARVSRALDAATTATATINWTNYSQTDVQGAADEDGLDRWTAGLQLARKLGRTSSVSALAQHRNNVLGTSGEGSGTENRVSVSFTTEF